MRERINSIEARNIDGQTIANHIYKGATESARIKETGENIMNSAERVKLIVETMYGDGDDKHAVVSRIEHGMQMITVCHVTDWCHKVASAHGWTCLDKTNVGNVVVSRWQH